MSGNCTTTCRGVDAIDEKYGVGYQKHEGYGGFSPYPRTNKLIRDGVAMKTQLDSQRAVLVTEALKKYEACSLPMRWARAVENCLLHFSLQYYEDELLLGDTGGGNHTGQVFPEYSFDWVVDELKNAPLYEREYSKVYYDDRIKEEILSCEDYWKGKSVRNAIMERLSPEAKVGSHFGKMVFAGNLYADGGIGHHTPDWAMGIREGLKGIKEHVRRYMADDDLSTAEGIKKRDFHEAQLIVLEAASEYIRRYAAFAKELAETKTDGRIKSELLRMSANCEHVAENPPRDMWEALQLLHIMHMITCTESDGHSVSLGRLDQYLYPIYESDMKNGTLTKEFIQELMESFWIKSNIMQKMRDKANLHLNRGADRGWGTTSIVLGGVDKEGRDATNDLTFMWLDCIPHTRTNAPWPTLRIHEGTPAELKIKVSEIIRAGTGHPKLFFDEPSIDAMLRKGATLEEARDYVNVGCVELDAAGKEYGWHDAAYFSLVKVLELTLNDGRCMLCSDKCPNYPNCGAKGSRLGLKTGSLKDFNSMEELQDAFKRQLNYWVDRMVMCIELMDLCHQERKAQPWLSCLIHDCTEKGRDVSVGGAKYNGTGPQGIGIGTVADSFSALKQIVFDEKRYTGEQFLDALKNNWEGYEPLFALVNSEKIHHYGNDDDYADELALFTFNSYCEAVEKHKNSRGGKYMPGVYSVATNVPFGMLAAATPDGRKHGEPLSDNMGPVHTSLSSHDRLGPTALTNSLGKFDHARAMNGTLVNIKFGTETISGETGRENFISFVDAYREAKPMHLQVMVADRETLVAAQEHPEDYRDLLVRVSGFSTYFTQMSKNLQDDLISRTEESFE